MRHHVDMSTLGEEPHTAPRGSKLGTLKLDMQWGTIPVGTTLRPRLGLFPSWSWDPFKESVVPKGMYSRTSFLGRLLRDSQKGSRLDGGPGAEAAGHQASLGSTTRSYLKPTRTNE